jgi:hypothetical protein
VHFLKVFSGRDEERGLSKFPYFEIFDWSSFFAKNGRDEQRAG